MRVFIAALAGLLLTACAGAQMVSPRLDLVEHPGVGEEYQVELGETVLEKSRLSSYDGLILDNELQWGDGLMLKRFTISPGPLKARMQDDRFTYYFSENMTAKDSLLGTAPFHGGGLCQASDRTGPVKGFVVPGRCALNWGTPPQVRPTRLPDPNATDRRRQLVYNGRMGQTLSLLYREFSSNPMEPPQSQTLHYDLSEGPVIGFRGVRIEVVEASNTRLTYRVLASFPDP